MQSSEYAEAPVVSYDDEPLILVDEQDQVQGYASKVACHQGQGLLHRAFSIFLFNSRNQVLLQQRSGQKPLWPLYWSNSCCSHPRRGESDMAAAERRVREELGVTPPLRFLYRFRYQVPFGDKGAEHELCSVYAARSDDPVAPNPNEVADWYFMDADALDEDMQKNPDRYTPWFRMEWPRIRRDHWDAVLQLADLP